MSALHEGEYVTLTFVVRAPARLQDDPRTMLTNENVMFWANEDGISDKAVALGADPALWHDEQVKP